jgi:hypothetical protein
VSFIHVVIEHDIDDPASLQDVAAFQAFVAGLADRCGTPPATTEASICWRLPLMLCSPNFLPGRVPPVGACAMPAISYGRSATMIIRL